MKHKEHVKILLRSVAAWNKWRESEGMRSVVDSGVHFDGPQLNGPNLFKADLSEAKLNNVNLSNVLLGGANLGGANLSNANLIVDSGDSLFNSGEINILSPEFWSQNSAEKPGLRVNCRPVESRKKYLLKQLTNGMEK